jgi:protein-L-isoaspartate(D-aspartate) O-methyltransferase
MTIPSQPEPLRGRRIDVDRGEMLDLIRSRGISDERVLGALRSVDRHLFVPGPFASRAYEDTALPIGHGQTISQPYTVAFMTEALGCVEGDKVLEVGTGSGYQAAVLSAMGMHVFSIERNLELLSGARKIFDRLGLRVVTRGGDGTVGWSQHAPYQGILVTAAAPEVPAQLLKQLADRGKLVIPVGDREIQSIVVVTRHGDDFERTASAGFKFVPLIGKAGWGK